MNNQDNIFEKRAKTEINKLKETYVIDPVTGQRIQEILVYLYLSQGSKNQRGIILQTEKLRSVLHTCPKIMTSVYSAPKAKSVCHA